MDAEQVKRYREAELTHGRVCMLAALGFLVGEAVQDKTLFWNWDGNIQGACLSLHARSRAAVSLWTCAWPACKGASLRERAPFRGSATRL